MLIDRWSLNDMLDRTRYPLAACKPPLCYIHRARAHTHSHDEVIVIENPFRCNFDTVADSPSCLLSDVPACETRFRNETNCSHGTKILMRRFGEKPPYEAERIVSIKFD